MKTCYTYLCERIDSFFGVNRSDFEHENQMYCIMQDGDFTIKKKCQPQIQTRVDYNPYLFSKKITKK
jgi:hypothetical protein